MKKQVLKRISEFIAALTALLLLVPFCACAAPTGGMESQEPTEAISAAPETAGSIEDFSMEESIRSGAPERIDYKLLFNDGIRIDVDGDGVKETITASNVEGGSGDMLHLKLNGKDTNILVENGASVRFVSLLGSSIQIAEEERFPASRMEFISTGICKRREAPACMRRVAIRSASAVLRLTRGFGRATAAQWKYPAAVSAISRFTHA